MARPSEHDGVLYRRSGTKFWWMWYHDRVGKRRQETTGTSDWHEAQKKLRERLQARDDNILDIVCKGEQLPFEEWVDFFLENYSKPPLRAPKTHEANSRAAMHLKTAFGLWKLADVSGEAIEGYLRHRLRQHVQVKTAAGVVRAGFGTGRVISMGFGTVLVQFRCPTTDFELTCVWKLFKINKAVATGR